jgi:hypothetical protein
MRHKTRANSGKVRLTDGKTHPVTVRKIRKGAK